ncbi:hypothetical protein KEM52_006368 [Ascosphaera acerosa]|nr:hypothetical protein KEM52_006368 [Ascosphaera acerosa]
MVPEHLTGPKDVGINLDKGSDEYFKWFLASLLFGKPVQQPIAIEAYNSMDKKHLTSPEAITDAGWDGIRETLDEAHYKRYDHDTSWKLMGISNTIKDKYGSFDELMSQSKPSIADFEQKLRAFKGVGPKVSEIFMREAAPKLEEQGWEDDLEE